MQMSIWFNLLKRWWVSILSAMIAVILFVIANAKPNIQIYTTQMSVDKIMIALLGVVYRAAKSFPNILGAVFIALFVFVVVSTVQQLFLRRRFPTLLPIVLLFAANCIVFGAPGLIFSPSVDEPITDCDLYINGDMGIRVIRYPIDIRLEYAEQQFFLITGDGGNSWRQFAQTFVYNPGMSACQTIRFSDNLSGVIEFERSTSKNRTQLIHLITQDGGKTWTEENR